MEKKKFYIKQEQVTTTIWEYFVETDTIENARKLVENGEVKYQKMEQVHDWYSFNRPVITILKEIKE